MPDNELEQLKRKIAQLEAERGASDVPPETERELEPTVSDEPEFEQTIAELKDAPIQSENRFLAFLKETLLPFLIRKWRWVLATLIALAISIWLSAAVWQVGVISALVGIDLIGGIAVLSLLLRRQKRVLANLVAFAIVFLLIPLVSLAIYSNIFLFREGYTIRGIVVSIVLLGGIAVVYPSINSRRVQRTKRRNNSNVKRYLWSEGRKETNGRFLCRYCERIIRRLEDADLDHIKPIRYGGTNELHNMQLICSKCNRRKGTKSHQEYMQITQPERQRKRAQSQKY